MIERKNYGTFIAAFLFLITAVVVAFTMDDIIFYGGEDVDRERKEELESMKEGDFYNDRVLRYLGWSKQEVSFRHGEPDMTTPHYVGGEEYHYDRLSKTFVFAGEEGVVNSFYLRPGARIMGVEVGMSFPEVREVLGEPEEHWFSEIDGEYVMLYFFGEEVLGGAEVELWVNSKEKEGETNRIDVFWKKYWWN